VRAVFAELAFCYGRRLRHGWDHCALPMVSARVNAACE